MNKPILFLHIDKCGGMSLREYLAAQFEREAIMPVVHHPKASYQPDCYPTIDTPLDTAHHLFEVMYKPAQHQLVMGHWDTSILRHVPDATTIVVLREPFARFVSLYSFICQEQGQYPKLSIAVRRMGIMNFAERYQSLYANVMTQQLAGVRWCRAESNLSGVRLLHRAIQNLDAIDYVFTKKHMYKLVQKLSSDYDWQIDYKFVNKTQYGIGEIPIGVADYVRDVCEYDVELYEYAMKREKEM